MQALHTDRQVFPLSLADHQSVPAHMVWKEFNQETFETVGGQWVCRAVKGLSTLVSELINTVDSSCY